MKAPARKPDPAAAPPSQQQEGRGALSRAFSPEILAARAVARKPTTPSGHRVKLALTLFLPHDLAGYLTARALREGKNVAGLVGEIIAAERRRT